MTTHVMSLFWSRTTYFELHHERISRRETASIAPSGCLDNPTDSQSSILLDNTDGTYIQVRRRHSRTSEHDFNSLLIESLDESVAMVLGEIAKRAVYETIDKNYNIARSHIPEKLNEFTMALEAIFGVTASKTMTRVIIKRLYSKLGLTFVERPDWRLPDYATEARSRMSLFSELVKRAFVS